MKPKVLVVDDKEENLFAISAILETIDVEPITATNGNDGLKCSLEHDFAVALVDVQMPEMDGYELAQLLRDVEVTKNLPIIFVSAIFSDDFHIFKGYDSGAVDFLTKPFNPKVLLSKVQVFIDLYLQKKQLEEVVEELKNTNIKLKMMEGVLLTARNLEDQINNPLAIISMNAELLQEDLSADKLDYVKAILDNTQRITKHISEIKNMKELKVRESCVGPMLDIFQKTDE